MKKIGYVGLGAWGYCLSRLLALQGHTVTAWNIDLEVSHYIKEHREHPKFKGYKVPDNFIIASCFEEVVTEQDMIVESVSSAGIRSFCEQLKIHLHHPSWLVLTSKGIEQNTGLLHSEVMLDVLGQSWRTHIGCLSGPSIALEVMKGMPTAVVGSGYSQEVIHQIQETFATPRFRVYANLDIHGVELGAALKNIIAIAVGACDGLGFGDNTKSALMTRGLHEMRRLAKAKGCNPETLNGLSGMGDLCVTCSSSLSRNFRFGHLIAQGMSMQEAKASIGMVVEGSYACISALQLAHQYGFELPITETVYLILYKNLPVAEAVKRLMERAPKMETA